MEDTEIIEIKDKMTLDEILYAFEKVENGLARYHDDGQDLIAKQKEKADNYHDLFDRMDQEVLRQKEIAERAISRAQMIITQRDKIKENLKSIMKQNHFEKITGNRCSFWIGRSEKWTPKREPTEADFERVDFEPYVRQSVNYRWDIDTIKKVCKSHPNLFETFDDVIHVQKNETLRTSLKGKSKNDKEFPNA